MMWWLASVVGHRTPQGLSSVVSPNWYITAAGSGRFWLWHGQAGAVVRLHRVDVPGCSLLVVGCCTTSDTELSGIAVRIACGDMAALAEVDGSRVVIAVRADDVWAAGDLAGQCPVFYGCFKGQVVVGSHAGALAELVGRSLNREWLAARLLVPSASDVWWTQSPWHGVRTVRPGWLLHVNPDGKATTKRWLDLDVPRAGLADGSQALRAALRRAVSVRVAAAEMPTVDLSGGLDSSTVALLAARAAPAPVRALTLTVNGVEDASAAAHAAGTVSGMAYKQLEIPDAVLPYSDLDRPLIVDEPADHLVAGAWVRWWRRCLAEDGSDVHLSGDGGDGVLFALPSYLADLASPHTLRTLWRHANGWARLRNQAPHTLVRAAMALRGTPYREAFVRAADRLIQGDSGPIGWARLISWIDLGGAGTLATSEARHLVASYLRRHAEEHTTPAVPGRFGIGDATAWLSLNAYARGLRSEVAVAATCGITLQSPYLDDGVVRACWSVPASVRTTPEQPKPLLRHAVDGLVPASVVNRRTKGDYTALSYRGLHRNADAIDHVLTSSQLGSLGLIDVESMRAELRKGAAGLPIRLGAFDTVLGMELWLRAIEVN
ncbi:MAG: albusnodin/ikarugamycin family macrolactam cyclase [Pseudonocardiales bacterium]|nr:albusnodin/ikarugamycin family macrolactam cyclase [Pseudonocardiales bacterium]